MSAYPETYTAQQFADSERCEVIFNRVVDKLQKEAERLKTPNLVEKENHEKFSVYLPDMSIFEILHPELEVYSGDYIYITFQKFTLGHVIYDYRYKEFKIMDQVGYKTEKGISINYETVLSFYEFMFLILKAYWKDNKTIDEIELIFQKMEFESC